MFCVLVKGVGGKRDRLLRLELASNLPSSRILRRLLLDALPQPIIVRGVERVQWVMQKMAREQADGSPGASVASAQLAHLMFIHVLRAHIASDVVGPGWLRAVVDRRLEPALRKMHANPGHPWQLGELAKTAAMSRSTFAAHVSSVAGCSPIAYLTEWRIHLARHALSDDPQTSVGELAAKGPRRSREEIELATLTWVHLRGRNGVARNPAIVVGSTETASGISGAIHFLETIHSGATAHCPSLRRPFPRGALFRRVEIMGLGLHMQRTNRQIRLALGNTFAHRMQRGTMLLTLSASLGATFFLSACGSSDAGDSSGGDLGGRSGLAGSGNSAEEEIDSDTVVEAATQAAALSEEDLSAALAAADLDGEMALAGPSGLTAELGGEMIARFAWAGIGTQMKSVADSFAAGSLFGTQRPQSVPNIKWPGVRVQAGGGGGVGEAFGAGWLGGSLFNAYFVETVINAYSEGESGSKTNSIGSVTDGGFDVTATAALSDTLVTLDATANFILAGLSATIKTHSGIPCPDVNGLVTVNSSLDVTGKAGNAFQNARFSFELIVEVNDDSQLTGRNQLKSSTRTHTADSSKGYDVTDGSADVSITEFADGHFGDGKGTYKGMTNDEAIRWMNAGLLSGTLYRDQLLPKLQKMLDAGRCVTITVEPSAGPMNLEPFTNVDLLTKPRAKSSNSGVTTGGTVQARFKTNAGGSIAELGDKVPADATFHYISPLGYSSTEKVTFEARSKRGTGKLDYTLTTSPHAD